MFHPKYVHPKLDGYPGGWQTENNRVGCAGGRGCLEQYLAKEKGLRWIFEGKAWLERFCHTHTVCLGNQHQVRFWGDCQKVNHRQAGRQVSRSSTRQGRPPADCSALYDVTLATPGLSVERRRPSVILHIAAGCETVMMMLSLWCENAKIRDGNLWW